MNAPLSGESVVERELTAAFDEMAAGYVPTPMDASTLWATGRRERRGDLIEIVAAVLVLVVVVASAWRLQAPDPGPADSPSGGALPTQVHYPYNEQLDAVERPDGMHTGALSVVVKEPDGPAIGVRASDGTHLLLDLRHLGAGGGQFGDGDQPIALSRDGARLAWAYRTSGNVGAASESAGITVADLTTGKTYDVELLGVNAERLAVDRLTFSPDGTRIGWVARSYLEGVKVTRNQFVGVLDVEVRSSTTGSEASDVSALTVLDDGTLHTHHGDEHRNWVADEFRILQPGPATSLRADRALEYGAVNLHVSPDGKTIVGDTYHGDPWGVVVEPADDLTATVAVIDHALNTAAFSTPLLGLSPGGVPVVAYVESDPDDGGARDGRVLALAHAPDDPDGPPVVLTQVDTWSSPMVATDFTSTDPVAFPAPQWAAPTPTWVWWLLGTTGTLTAGWLLVLWARRSRSHGGGNWIRPALTSVAAAGVTGALVVTLAPVLEPVVAPRPDVVSETGALPATLHPETWGQEWPDATAETTARTAPGPLSVVGRSIFQDHSVTGIQPRDGQPITLDLPGLPSAVGSSMDEETAALSPDGTRLAYVWNGARPDVFVEPGERDQVARGVAILDLTTGFTSTVELADVRGDSIWVREFSWSPDSVWLGWSGVSTRRANRMQQWVGLTQVAGARGNELSDRAWTEKRGNYRAIAAGDGVLHLLAGKRLITYAADEDEPVRDVPLANSPGEWSGAALSSDGETLYVGLAGENATSYATGIRMIDLTSVEPRLETSAWRSDLSVHVEGVTPSGDVVASQAGDGGYMRERLVRIDPMAGTSASIVDLPDAVHSGFSWAIDLADRDPVEFPPPPSELSVGRIMLAALLVLVLGLILGSAFTRRRKEA